MYFRFYFPNGNPTGKLSVDAVTKRFTEAFSKQSLSSVTTEQLGQVLKVSKHLTESVEYNQFIYRLVATLSIGNVLSSSPPGERRPRR